VLFLIVNKLMGVLRHEVPPATKVCPECMEKVPVEAKRCRACASALA